MAVNPIPLYVAATAHGFGHVTRLAAVVNTLRRQDAQILPIWVTPAPAWLLQRYGEGEFVHRPPKRMPKKEKRPPNSFLRMPI